MSGNRWNAAGVPHKGWACIDVVDLLGDGMRADETRNDARVDHTFPGAN